MKKHSLFNKINREVLKKELLNEAFQRVTISFYKYFEIVSPELIIPSSVPQSIYFPLNIFP